MRIEQTFAVAAPPEAVFDFMTQPGNLMRRQFAGYHENLRRHVEAAR